MKLQGYVDSKNTIYEKQSTHDWSNDKPYEYGYSTFVWFFGQLLLYILTH